MVEDFFRRWSRLKHRQDAEKPAQEPAARTEDKPVEEKGLPPLEKLTPESDFTGFMQPKVDGALRRAALKKLFGDPHFNIPDPFEPFSGDWTGEALSPEMLATLNQAKTLLFDKQHEEPKQEQTKEEKSEEKVEEKIEEKIEKAADEPRRQDA